MSALQPNQSYRVYPAGPYRAANSVNVDQAPAEVQKLVAEITKRTGVNRSYKVDVETGRRNADGRIPFQASAQLSENEGTYHLISIAREMDQNGRLLISRWQADEYQTVGGWSP